MSQCKRGHAHSGVDNRGHSVCRSCRRFRARRLKQEVVDALGGRCACCNESWLDFLVIDHVGGGGNRHRVEVGEAGRFYSWLKRNGYPAGFQVLCADCNMAKERGGCPGGHRGTKPAVRVVCSGEEEQKAVYDQLAAAGLTVRVVTV